MNMLTNSADYYSRDQQLNIDPKTQYISNLKKLGYWEFNKKELTDKFIGEKLIKLISIEFTNYSNDSQIFDFSTFESSSIGSFILKIKCSDKYQEYIEYLDRIELRAKLLSECGYDKFYELCTPEELIYLGW